MRALSRRSLHGLLVGAAALPLAGCDLDDLRPESAPATPPPPTADERLVEEVATAVRAARNVATAVPAGAALVAVHDGHLAVLEGPSATTTATPTPSAAPAPTDADLRSAEQSLETTLTDAAGRAEDGGLARLLASMSAAVAQQLVVLPKAGR